MPRLAVSIQRGFVRPLLVEREVGRVRRVLHQLVIICARIFGLYHPLESGQLEHTVMILNTFFAT